MTSQPPDPSPCLFNDPSVFVKTEYDQGKMTFGCMSVVNKPGLRAPGSELRVQSVNLVNR